MAQPNDESTLLETIRQNLPNFRLPVNAYERDPEADLLPVPEGGIGGLRKDEITGHAIWYQDGAWRWL